MARSFCCSCRTMRYYRVAATILLASSAHLSQRSTNSEHLTHNFEFNRTKTKTSLIIFAFLFRRTLSLKHKKCIRHCQPEILAHTRPTHMKQYGIEHRSEKKEKRFKMSQCHSFLTNVNILNCNAKLLLSPRDSIILQVIAFFVVKRITISA